MLRDTDFIVFSDDWGRHPFSCRHIMRAFLPDNRLLWVQTIGLRTPRLTMYDLTRACGKIAGWLRPFQERQATETHSNLRIVSPIMLPFNRIACVRALNRRSVVAAVRGAMRAWGMKYPVMLATVPNAADYAGYFGERMVVYYCVDDFSLWPGMNQPELVRAMERDLIKAADLVAVSARTLRAGREGGKGPVRLLSHGVDVAHFSRSAGRPPEAMEGLARPVIGFYGLLDERLDLDLLEAAARARREWTFVFIGNSLVRLDRLSGLPNVLLIPAVPYGDLPRYAARFDVAVVPYLVNRQTEGINPLKLREYIATGKQVVSTPLPEARALAHVIRIGEGAEGFIRAVEEALADTSPPEKRLAALEGESWQDKAELLSGWIAAHLAGSAIQEREQ